MIRFKPRELIDALTREARGGTAVIFALGAPALALLACGAIDIAAVNSDRSAMQDAADATALAMAKQLGVGTATGIKARATDYADAQLGKLVAADGLTVTTTIAADNSSVTVAIDGARGSFFGDLLPPGGWKMHAQATAATVGELPLCVLGSGASAPGDIQLQNTSLLTASNCLVQSNGDISADAGADLTAGLAQATGSASGPITPAPQTGAPAIPDPFASMTFTPPLLGLCDPLDLTAGINLVLPGTHCANITVGAGQTMVLLPGEHYFAQGVLRMQQNSVLTGSNVVLVFNDDASFQFADSSQINLTGRQSGTFAGFVIATTRNNTNTFVISSDAARKLEGAIYVPNATLQVTGAGNQVADQSAWTVVVAQALQLQGSPNLVINANYAGSNVPVPAGAGSNYHSGKVALAK
ncbi:MAG TPA: pilus assembly protein TadG-related protein [Caulobacteraceae bacterium]|nr:pilus assembly protein TadG-related protein [Caulobacteraceae bacterium]